MIDKQAKKVGSTLETSTISSVFAVIISFVSLLTSIHYSYKSLLPESASLIISKEQIELLFSDETLTITPKIKNIGDSSAFDINYQMYTVDVLASSTYSQKMDEDYIDRLEPAQEIHLSASLMTNFEKNKDKKETLILIQIQYTDSLTEERVSRFYTFKIKLGEKGVSFQNFYGKDMIKLKTSLLPEIERSQSKNKSLIKYLQHRQTKIE